MEIKDRTQASYNLVDINEQTRIAFEKCKETKEQKIEQQRILNNYGIKLKGKELKKVVVKTEQELKELEDDNN